MLEQSGEELSSKRLWCYHMAELAALEITGKYISIYIRKNFVFQLCRNIIIIIIINLILINLILFIILLILLFIILL